MREHIHDAGRTNVPAAFMLQNCAVTCKRSRIAGNVDHAGRTFFSCCQHAGQRQGAFARRIDQHAVDAAHGLPEPFPVLFAPRKKIPRTEGCFLSQSVFSRPLTSAGDQAFGSLNTDHPLGAAGERQRKVAQAAEEIGHLVIRLESQETHCAADHRFVERMVDLREVCGLKSDAYTEFRQLQPELFFILGINRMSGFRSFWLKPNIRAVCSAKSQQLFHILGRHRIQMTENERCAAVAADSDFYLRHPLAHIEHRDQLTKRINHVGNVLRQNRAGMHIAHIARSLFVEPHQNTALFGNIANRQACTMAVIPKRSANGRQNVFRFDLADVPERVHQNALLEGHLRIGFNMLHRAAAAGSRPETELGAAGSDARPALREHRRCAADIKTRFRTQTLIGHAFAGKRPLNKDHLAVEMRYAASFLIKTLHVDSEVFGRPFF